MKVLINGIKLDEADAVVVPVFVESEKSPLDSLEAIFKQLKASDRIKGEESEIVTSNQINGSLYQNLIFVGFGKKEALNSEKIRIALSKVLKKLRELKAEKIYIQFTESDGFCTGKIVKAMVEGLNFGDYSFDKYKTDKKEKSELEISIAGVPEEKLDKVAEYVEEASILSETTLLARDLVNEPANALYPQTFAMMAANFGKRYGFEVKVFDEKQIDDLGMKALLSVAKASNNPPRLIVMRYFGDNDSKEILGLVGKGLTYDSGGYSIKTNDGMLTMKSDMGGGASVLGAISAIAKRKIKVNVVAVIAACENLISGGAYKPGDIIGSMGGKTIEIMSTDAEGRLTLADAVHYIISEEKATKVVDLATLTGAAVGALGSVTTAVVTNDDNFYKELEAASEKSGEKMWKLPSFDEYKKLIKSDIADLKNTGGKYAGAITAGLFVGEFVQNKPWLHLDIAGTAWSDNEKDYFSKGGTGVGVRTLYYLAKGNK